MNILMVYGGKSCEHDISVITACLAKGYFDGNVYGAYLSSENVCYYVPNDFTPKQHKTAKFTTQITFVLGKKQIALVRHGKIKKTIDIDVVVNCCHGLCGEDGAIAGLCELCNLPLVGSNIISGAVSMDKIFTKHSLTAWNFPNMQGVGLDGGYTEKDIAELESWGYPLIVKPSTLGSSIGITLCHNREELQEALNIAFRYDFRVLCEKALTDFYELNCAAMQTSNGVETSKVERPFTTHDILTFQDKYQQNSKFVPTTTEVPAELQTEVQRLTKEIYRKFALNGVVRVDYLVDNVTGKLYVNEINSVPGSLAYGLWQHKYSPMQYGAVLLENAVSEYARREKLDHNYNSGVLENSYLGKK